MPKLIDITGQRFGRLVAIEPAAPRPRSTGSTRTRWLCQCDCGRRAIVATCSLRATDAGHPVRSCGCLHDGHPTHNESKTRLHRIWSNMKTRCLNSRVGRYKDYGGRGITICGEWQENFTEFRDWALSHGYADKLTVDRIDNDGDYEPRNCRWVTLSENARHRRRQSHV